MSNIELKESIDRVEKLQKRGLITLYEAENRINQLIDEALPEGMGIETLQQYNARIEQRRLAKRRLWRFLLSATKEKVNVGI